MFGFCLSWLFLLICLKLFWNAVSFTIAIASQDQIVCGESQGHLSSRIKSLSSCLFFIRIIDYILFIDVTLDCFPVCLTSRNQIFMRYFGTKKIKWETERNSLSLKATLPTSISQWWHVKIYPFKIHGEFIFYPLFFIYSSFIRN